MTWIRLKVAPYKNNLAFILNIETAMDLKMEVQLQCMDKELKKRVMFKNTQALLNKMLKETIEEDQINVVLIPRFCYSKQDRDIPLNKHRRHNRGTHIHSQQLFSPFKAKDKTGQDSWKTEYSDLGEVLEYRYNGLVFDPSGFLLYSVTWKDIHHIDIYPSVREMEPFLKCVSISKDVKTRLLRNTYGRELKAGDHVKVLPTQEPSLSPDDTMITRGDRTGTTEEVYPTFCSMRLDMDTPGLAETIEINNRYIRKFLKTGDVVSVNGGSHAGYIGHVVVVNEAEGILTISNLKAQPDTVYVNLHQVEFASWTHPFAAVPAPHQAEDMRDFGTLHYENLPAVVIHGPLKGHSGIVKTVNLNEKTLIELRDHLYRSRKLEEVMLDKLAFEL
ncbi:hypothetical protein AN958_07364 [Leucoagaricus sp. SymC.cos]|nr:hypothetical protein AN958_07364 [Leucoagaricus sp. SymC.cos]